MNSSEIRTAETIRREAIAWLARRDAGFSAEAATEFSAWQAADPRRAAAVAELAGAWSALDRPRATGHGEWLRVGLQRRAARRRQQRLTALAAVLCVGISLALWLPWNDRSSSPLVAASPTARVVVAAQETLPDGSVAEFAPGSRIDPRFDAAERRVRLVQGEVHFAVRKDAARPFVVEAGGVAVRAVGTAFAVRLEADRVRVIVTEGTVAVADTRVHAGSELVVSTGNEAPSALDPAALAQRLAWRVPRLEFTETTLAEAAALFGAHAGPRLVPADATVAALRVTGVFRADNVEGFVDLVGRTLGLVAERSGDTITLRAAPARK